MSGHPGQICVGEDHGKSEVVVTDDARVNQSNVFLSAPLCQMHCICIDSAGFPRMPGHICVGEDHEKVGANFWQWI